MGEQCTRRTYHDSMIDHLHILTCHYEMLCRICKVQIHPTKCVLDHAEFTAPTRQHELDNTDQETDLP